MVSGCCCAELSMPRFRISLPCWGQYRDLGAGWVSLCPVFPDMEMHQEMNSVVMNFSDEVFSHWQSACAAVKLN